MEWYLCANDLNLSLLACLESAYSLNDGVQDNLGKHSGYFMIIRWPINCFVYQWHYMPACKRQMLQCHFFTVVASVEASSPLKVLSFNQRALFTMSFNQWTLFTMNSIELCWMWTLLSFIYCELDMNPETIWMTIELMWRTVVKDLIGTLIKQFKV